MVNIYGTDCSNAWIEYFKSISNNDPNDVFSDESKEISKFVNDWHKCSFNYPPSILDAPITVAEVKYAIDKSRRNKASGIDNLFNEFFKYGGDVLWQQLTTLFNIMFDQETIPDDWCRAIIVPLFKGGDRKMVNNYRGISLLSVVGKLYASVINNRLINFVESNNLLVEEQAGFRRKRSTIEQIFILFEIISSRSKSKKHTYCCFIDVRKAYDSVFRDSMWWHLIHKGIAGKMYRVLRAFYNKVESCVQLNGKYSDFFTSDIGVRQGCLLSPILFSIFINGLAEAVKGLNVGVNVMGKMVSELLFADDIVLMAENAQDLQLYAKTSKNVV